MTMATLKARWKIAALCVGIVIVVGLIFFWVASLTSPAKISQNIVSASTTITTATNAVPSSGDGGESSNVARIPAIPGRAITIHLMTPISDSVWKIGGANSITWDTPAGITGEIDLVNTNTEAFVGVILSETGPNQTSYSWDARSIYLARYSADKKDIVPGTYSIVLHFDGNGLGDLVSPPVTITN